MIPILMKDIISADASLTDDNQLVGNLVAKVAATYQQAKMKHDNGIDDETQKLFVYSKSNLFSSTGGNQKITDALGRCRIDCSGFASLVLRGVTYDKSPYARYAGTPNAIWNPMDDWDSDHNRFSFCGSYGWEFTEMDSYPQGQFNDIGIPFFSTMRTAADIAEYFFENGTTIYDSDVNSAITYSDGFAKLNGNYLCEILHPGDLICWAKPNADEEQQGRFRSISHIGIVAERTSWFYHSTTKGSAVNDDSDSTTIQGGVYYSELDAEHIEYIELILRPHYRIKANNRYPSGENLISYPPRWGSSYVNTSDGVTYKWETVDNLKLNGTSPSGTTVGRNIRQGETVNDYFVKDNLVKLIPGRYRVSMKQISGTVTTSSGNSYKGEGFAIWVRNKDGDEMPSDNDDKIRANAALTTTFEVDTETYVRVTLHIGNSTYNFNNVVIQPKLKLLNPFIDGGRQIESKEKIAHLRDAVSCKVTEERNGAFCLEMEYPVAGVNFSDLAENLIIKAKPNKTDANQYFRIKEISKPLDGLVTIYANHISYDLSGYPVSRYKQTSISASAAISGILGSCEENIQIDNPFSLSHCDIATLHSVDLKAVSARAALGGTEGSALDVYGGEFKFDNYNVNLYRNRGRDNGVRISYGKNLVGMKLNIDTDSAYTGLFPYAYGDNDAYISLPEGTIYVANNSGVAENILLLDCSNLFADGQTKNEENLRIVANDYLDSHDINEVNASMDVEMLDLSKSSAFDYFAAFEAVNLCDIVKVIHTKLGVSIKLKVIKTVFDSLGERYEKLELGSNKSDMASTVAQAAADSTRAIKIANEGTAQLLIEYQRDLDEATKAITGASGGHVVLNPPMNPQEIRILCDTDDVNTSQKYWLWNSAGLMFTSDGGNTATFALRGSDGKLVINEATAALITADMIKAGSIISEDGKMIVNLDSGTITTTDSTSLTKLRQGIFEISSVAIPANKFELMYAYEPVSRRASALLSVSSTSSDNPAIDFALTKGSSLSPIASFERDRADFYKEVSIGHTIAPTDWTGFRLYRTNKNDGKTSNVVYGLGFYSNKPMIRIDAKDSNNKVSVRFKAAKITSYSGVGSIWLENEDNGESAKLTLGASSLQWGGTVIPYPASTSGEDYITKTENPSSIESDIMNYFINSDITVKPETLVTTSAHSETLITEGENGEIIEETIEHPASSETIAPYAAFTSAEDVPSILLSADEESVDLSSMACLMWQAIKELNARLEAIENGGNA